MATPTLTANLTTISDCESITGWSGPTLALDPDLKKQGSNSISAIQRNDGQQIYYSVTNQDYSGQHIRFWITTGVYGQMKTKANGGLRFFLYDGTNTAYWNIAGIDTYSGGWINIVVDADSTPDSGTVNTTSIDRVGVEFGMTSSFKRVINTWFDYLRYGDGLTVTGGTDGDEIDLDGIAVQDANNGYGIVEKNAVTGVNAIYGEVKIGNGSTTTYFKETGVNIFADAPVNSSLYKLFFQGSGCHVKIIGSTIEAYNRTWTLDVNEANIASAEITGNTFSQIDNAYFKSGQTIKNNVFDKCGQIDPSTSTFQNNTVSNTTSTVGAVLLPSSTTNFKNNNYLNNTTGAAIDIPSGYASTSNSDGDYFDGNTYDYNNQTGATHTVSKLSGSNPSTYTGSLVIFTANYTFKFTLKPSITGYEWRLYSVTSIGDMAGAVELDGEENATADNQTYVFSNGGSRAVQIISQPNEDYEESITYYTFGNADQDVTILLKKDINN